MAKTYTINSSSMNAGRSSSLSSNWTGFQLGNAAGLVTGYSSAGYSSAFYRAVNILFNSSDLNQFASKTITKIILRITITSGTLGSSSYPYRVRYKYDNQASTASSGYAWASGTAAGGTLSSTDVATWSNGQTSGTTSITANSTHDFNVGTTIPAYGYVIAGATGNAYMTLASSAQLLITTNEIDYTLKLTYNANGGSGGPSAQSATVTTTGTPSYTFTIPNTSPTRTGYTFKGWATSASATTAAYHGGDTYTITANKTLYAVWQSVTYTVSYNKGSYGTGTNTTDTKTYGVSLTLKGAIFTRNGYKQSGWSTTDGGSKTYNLSGTYTANAAVTLYPFWEVTSSTISASNGTIGSAISITITRASSAYTHTVSYSFGTASGTIGTNIATSTSWTPDMSLCSQVTNATSGQCVLTCTTYQGTTLIGSSTKTITLSVPSAVKCTITSVALAETVASVAAQFSAFVQTKSKVSVTATTSTTNAYGATVASYSISINGQTLTSNGAVTNALTTAGSNSYTVTIKDTRGRSATYTDTFNVLAYVAPSVSSESQRDSGTPSTINVSYGWTISNVNNLNTKQVLIRYRMTGGNWTVATTITPATYSGTGTYAITGTESNGAYEVQVRVTDFFTTVSLLNEVASIGDRLLYYSASDMTISKHDDNPKDGNDHQFFHEVFHNGITVSGTSSIANANGDLSTTGITANDGNPSAVTVPTATWTTISTINLTKGTWLIYATSRFASNATGYRRHILTGSDSETSSNAIQMDDTRVAVNGAYTFTRSLNHYTLSGNKTYYLRVYQNSGSSLSVTGRLYATKII